MTSPPPSTPKRKLRWYQFSLRTLLIFVTLFGIACSWFAVKIRQAKRQDNAVLELRKMGFLVRYDYQNTNPFISDSEAEAESVSSSPSWLRKKFGKPFFDNVIMIDGHTNTDKDLNIFKEFNQLKFLSLENSIITKDRLEYISGLTHLEYLYLSHSTITDDSLYYLKRLHNLKTLNVVGTDVSESGIEDLQKELPNIEVDK
jgi:hypothetical protein